MYIILEEFNIHNEKLDVVAKSAINNGVEYFDWKWTTAKEINKSFIDIIEFMNK